MNAWKIVLAVFGGLAACLGLGVLILSLRPGAIPPVTGADGKPVPGSVAAWEPVVIGGVRQWLAIRGRDPANPVLLFVHGGPGDAETPLLFHYNRGLCNYFTLVSWEQRGAGRSFSSRIPAQSMNLDRFVEDAHEVTRYLKMRFRKERIYLAGHSWGSLVGILAAARYPEDYQAYIGISQGVFAPDSERISYQWALATARARNNRRAVRELERLGPPVNGQYPGGFRDVLRERRWVRAFGGAVHNGSIVRLAKVLIASPVYSLMDKVNWIRGGRFSLKHLWNDELVGFNLFEELPELSVPVYICQGRHDYQTVFVLAERYIEVLRAPRKRLIPFELSAHVVPFDEPERFQEALVDVVLKETLVETGEPQEASSSGG